MVSTLLSAGVRCMLMRGGGSKGAYFVADDLPADRAERDRFLLGMMGTPDSRQIDGIGGGTPLTSKVAIVSRSDEPDVDLDYLFLQLGVDQPFVTEAQNCGNILAGVGPFGVERGLVEVSGAEASIRIRMVNSDATATATFPVDGGAPIYAGTTRIASVPFEAAAITLDFDDIAGGTCGALLPTGNPVDLLPIDSAGTMVEVTCIDNGMPVVVLSAADFGLSGDEGPAELEADAELRSRLEYLRLRAGPLMNLGDVADTSVPKLTLVSPPRDGGLLSTRTFVPHRVHASIGVLGAVSVATAALLDAGPAAAVATVEPGATRFALEHPTGTFDATVELVPGTSEVKRAGIVRTARKLMDGTVFARD